MPQYLKCSNIMNMKIDILSATTLQIDGTSFSQRSLALKPILVSISKELQIQIGIILGQQVSMGGIIMIIRV